MTTWAEVDEESTSYDFPADELNGYVSRGYVRNRYIVRSNIWSGAEEAPTDWA